MSVIKKNINGNIVKYFPESDIISNKNIFNYDITSYQRTISNNIYDTCFEITTSCNQECTNCFSDSTYRKNGLEMDYSFIENSIKERIQKRIRFIISGGEPFLHSNICNILKLPSKYPLANYWLNTNGYIKKLDQYIDLIINNK